MEPTADANQSGYGCLRGGGLFWLGLECIDAEEAKKRECAYMGDSVHKSLLRANTITNAVYRKDKSLLREEWLNTEGRNTGFGINHIRS